MNGAKRVGSGKTVNGFDPNDELDTQEQADAYVNWCATNFMRLTDTGKRTYRSALRAAHWLFVVASAQLHLDESVEVNREEMLAQLACYQQLGRALERQREHYTHERLVVLRSSLDCWEPVGAWAPHLLSAAKCAASALALIESHPLVDLWELQCPDGWALLSAGALYLQAMNEDDDLQFADFAVRPDETAIAKFTWQKVRNVVRGAGIRVDMEAN